MALSDRNLDLLSIGSRVIWGVVFLEILVLLGSPGPARGLIGMPTQQPPALTPAEIFIQESSFPNVVFDGLLAETEWPDDHRGDFLNTLTPEVLMAARKWRVPVSVTLAQAIQESGWGRSRLARAHHNLFGVKVGKNEPSVQMMTHEFRHGQRQATQSSFRVFNSWNESIQHHNALLSQSHHYADAQPYWTDWRRYLSEIASTYASDPNYDSRITKLIEDYELDQWDSLVAQAVQNDDVKKNEQPN